MKLKSPLSQITIIFFTSYGYTWFDIETSGIQNIFQKYQHPAILYLYYFIDNELIRCDFPLFNIFHV